MIDASDRMPQDGEVISLPGIKGRYLVHGQALYNHGRLAIPLCLVEKYMIEDGQRDTEQDYGRNPGVNHPRGAESPLPDGGLYGDHERPDF